MHRKRNIRWPRLVAFGAALAIAFGFIIAQVVNAVQFAPEPVCDDSACTLTVLFSGEPYVWAPPLNITDLHFDLVGAQGGQGLRSTSPGGLGGRVVGEITAIPASVMIYVGGAGSRGSSAFGGFNGGGNAGSGHGDEGSGGGATDLRSSSSLDDRLVVAGGGGGTGGYDWGTAGLGGSGGLLVGGSGGWGQAAPGMGGGQLMGGLAGQPNGGSKGTAGEFGIGGRGGSGRFAGGGGGGGGYFGGGGGGSDIDSAGLNGGGGGGGSSYADPARTSGVFHESGVRFGNGLAVFTYKLLVPAVVPAVVPSPTPVVPVVVPVVPAVTPAPNPEPTASSSPTPEPTKEPTAEPTAEPAAEPTQVPTAEIPALAPVEMPPVAPTNPAAEPSNLIVFVAEPTAPTTPAVEPQIEPSKMPPPEAWQSLWFNGLTLAESRPIIESLKTSALAAIKIDSASDSQGSLTIKIKQSPSAKKLAPTAPGPLFERAKIALAWLYSIAGALVLVGFIQALRRLKQNRRALARRFVRIS